MSDIGDIMEYNEEVEKRNKKKRNAKEIYSKYKESHLKAQKKYDDKNREKKHQYDKERWQKTKQMKEENERLHSIIKEAREYIEDNTYKAYETEYMDLTGIKELLEILDKVEKETDIEFDVLKALNTDLDDDVEMG